MFQIETVTPLEYKLTKHVVFISVVIFIKPSRIERGLKMLLF